MSAKLDALVPVRDLHSELLSIDRDLAAANPLGWGGIGFDLSIAIRALSWMDPGPVDAAAGAIGPSSLRERLHVVRDQLERHLADGPPPYAEPPLVMATSAIGAALVKVLREIGGFCRLGAELDGMFSDAPAAQDEAA